jgi:periplasmic copper chaperone A
MMQLLPSRRWRAAGPVARSVHALILSFGVLVGALMAGTTAQAAEGGLTISDPWIRTIVPSRPAAGYFTLSNKATKAQILVSASSPACGTLMLHRSVNQNGQERMVMVKSISVPAGGEAKFAPGGYHLMCMSPSKDVTPGHSVPVTLHFRDGGTLTASFPVRGATGQ